LHLLAEYQSMQNCYSRKEVVAESLNLVISCDKPQFLATFQAPSTAVLRSCFS